ncbi:MAG TPA: GNAT family N-acetyltransferase [bacterium]|nr:GNAT family N-acetyltransferase [bacterium]
MLLTLRPAESGDAEILLRLYEGVYHGGYSACFGKYGAIGPKDAWWIQSEKDVVVLELNHEPAGLLVFGRDKNRLLAEEVLLVPDALRQAPTAQALRTVVERVDAELTRRFQEARQGHLRLRTMERNPLGMLLVETGRFTIADTLVVSSLDLPAAAAGAEPAPDVGVVPEGYVVRRAFAGQDEEAVAQLDEECLGGRALRHELTQHLGGRDVRTFLATRDGYPVGFVMAAVRDGVGEWRLGVRETHRRRSVGTVLARTALAALGARGAHMVIGTHWAGDTVAEAFGSALDFTTERVYLYAERPL